MIGLLALYLRVQTLHYVWHVKMQKLLITSINMFHRIQLDRLLANNWRIQCHLLFDRIVTLPWLTTWFTSCLLVDLSGLWRYSLRVFCSNQQERERRSKNQVPPSNWGSPLPQLVVSGTSARMTSLSSGTMGFLSSLDTAGRTCSPLMFLHKSTVSSRHSWLWVKTSARVRAARLAGVGSRNLEFSR